MFITRAIPYKRDWEELLTSGHFDVSTYGYGGRRGLLVTVKGGTPWEAPTIFLPAQGIRETSSPSVFEKDASCYYWSCDLNVQSRTTAWIWKNEPDSKNIPIVPFDRWKGLPLRPVLHSD